MDPWNLKKQTPRPKFNLLFQKQMLELGSLWFQVFFRISMNDIHKIINKIIDNLNSFFDFWKLN